MLEDDYKKMIDRFKETIDGKPVQLDELCQESLGFFQKVQEMVVKGSDEDKQEALRMMGDMYETLLGETKKLTASTGYTEDQLMQFAANAGNFDTEQWKLMQKTRETLSNTGDSLVNYLKDKVNKAAAFGDKAAEKKKKVNKPGKDHWLRS